MTRPTTKPRTPKRIPKTAAVPRSASVLRALRSHLRRGLSPRLARRRARRWWKTMMTRWRSRRITPLCYVSYMLTCAPPSLHTLSVCLSVLLQGCYCSRPIDVIFLSTYSPAVYCCIIIHYFHNCLLVLYEFMTPSNAWIVLCEWSFFVSHSVKVNADLTFYIGKGNSHFGTWSSNDQAMSIFFLCINRLAPSSFTLIIVCPENITFYWFLK